MKIDNGSKKKFTVMMKMIIELYKIGMGTFLIYFVPQRCDDHICQIHELTYMPNIYNRIGICINAFTMMMILFTYVWECRREKWCIKNLNSTKFLPYDNLGYILHNNCQIERRLRFFNVRYIRALRLTAITCFINFLTSGYVISNRYLDISTPIGYFSFALLLLEKLKRSYYVGKKSYDNNLALSAYMISPLSFNTPVITDPDETGVLYHYAPLGP